MENNMNTSERQKLLHRVQVCDFNLIETNLYLNTHPKDQMALKHYKKYLNLREAAAKEFVSKFGPLTATDYDGGPTWKWVDSPWPWELEGEK